MDKISQKDLGVGTKCGAGKTFFIIDPEGYIKVCNHSPHRVCHYTQIDGLDKNEYWQKFAKCDYIPSMCNNCNHLDMCDGGCREAAHVYYGSISDKDPCFDKIN